MKVVIEHWVVNIESLRSTELGLRSCSFQPYKTIKITRYLQNWFRLEERAVIRFLWGKNVSASGIHNQIVEVYGDELMSRQHVANGVALFNQQVENLNMAESSWVRSSTTKIIMARVKEIIPNDRRVTVREISSELGLIYDSVLCIVSVFFRQCCENIRRYLAQWTRTWCIPRRAK
ncbi:histone-lysine N-methyltransferase SETMAR [Trichonephila clavipes]|nr:histone-lysine N-methyltransferase SETMAR [Trichonephila clavipes]